MSLFAHSWKSSVRSILWGRELGANIFLGVILSMLALNFLGLGLALRPILREQFPGEDPVLLLNGALLTYVFADLVLRLFFQKIPSVEVRSYMLLPIGRARILRFVLFRMLLSGFNIVPLFAIVPLGLTCVLPERDAAAAAAWMAGLLGTMFLSNILVLLIDKIGMKRSSSIPAVSLLLLTVAVAGYINLIDITGLSASFFGSFVASPLTAVGWVVGVILFFEGSVRAAGTRFTLASLTETRQPGGVWGEQWMTGRLHAQGILGSFLALEMKLLLRNARARASLLISLFVVFFVPFYYVMMAPRMLEPYAYPDPLPTEENLLLRTLPEEYLVRFIVHSSDVPPDAWMFITGNQAMLGPWKPSRVPLYRMDDSTWTRSLPLVGGTTLQYIFTLGTWKTEARTPELEPDVREIIIKHDTTIVHDTPVWREPRLDGFELFMLLYMALLLVAMPMLVYGQFLFVWESNYFDLLLTSPIAVSVYIRSKYALLLVFGVIGILFALPTYLISEDLLPIHLYAGIYNLGVNSFLLLFWSTLSKKRMDLSASIFSTQGKGSTNFLTILPTMILPIIIVILGRIIPGTGDGLYVLAACGILGLVFHRSLLALAERAFHARKYAMRAGFRIS